jgi:predicted SnoaL-like aldol condensation-catalyzing enzyme
VSSDAGKSILLRMLEMFATGDVASVGETIADDYRDHHAVPGVGARGAAAFKEAVRVARSAYTELDVWPEALFTSGDEVTARIHWEGVLPSGATVDRITMEVIRVANGRAVERWAKQLESNLRPQVQRAG